MRKLALYSVVLLMLGAAPALSLSDKPYLAETDADFANLLPPPPADGSAADKRDMKQLLDMQKAATPAQLAATLGSYFSPTTANAVEASPTQLRAPLILGSPEFMKR